MRKTLLRATAFFFAFILVRSTTVHAQFPYCPVGMFNNGTSIALSNSAIYADFPPGDYKLTVINDIWFNSTPNNCYVFDIPVTVTKTTNLSTCVPGAPAAPGICISNPNAIDCSYPMGASGTGNGLQQGATTILLKQLNSDDPFLTLNYFDYSLDECIYIALPVTWNPYPTLNWSTSQAVISWTTYGESNMDHFSVEKSTDGITYYKIAHVAATNTGSPHTYSHTSYIINRKNYYRIVAVDLDCNKQYSNIVYANCPSNVSNSICPATFTPPNLTPDCTVSGTQPYIWGADYICDNSKKLYRINNLKGNYPVTWSISPSYLATVSQAGRYCVVTPASSGIGTLTATYVKNGVTYSYSKNITIGIPPITVYTQNTIDQCSSFYTHTATISPFPGTNGIQYTWYVNGSSIGAGIQKTWNLPSTQWVSYEVRFNGYCGTSYYYGSTMGLIYDRPVVPEFSVSPNPAKAMIKISRRPPPCGFEPFFSRASLAKDRSTYVKVFDMFGGLRKMTQFKPGASTMDINAAGLPAGWYYINIIRDGNGVHRKSLAGEIIDFIKMNIKGGL